jgi:hypothetical protein
MKTLITIAWKSLWRIQQKNIIVIGLVLVAGLIAMALLSVIVFKNIFLQNWNSDRKEISTSYQMSFMPMMNYRIHF